MSACPRSTGSRVARLRRRLFVRDAELDAEPQRPSARQVHDLAGGDLRVGDDGVDVVAIDDQRGAQPDRLDPPDLAAHVHPLAQPERSLDQQRDAGDEVRQGLLRGEADRDADDAQRGDRGQHVHAELVHHHHEAHRRDRHRQHVPQQLTQRAVQTGTTDAGLHDPVAGPPEQVEREREERRQRGVAQQRTGDAELAQHRQDRQHQHHRA